MVDETPNPISEEPRSGEDERPNAEEHATEEQTDPGRSIRAWFWLALVAAFGLFLVFGSVQAHYWQREGGENHLVTSSKNVLDIWDAQLNGLPSVAHDTLLKTIFLVCVFGFLALTVLALWLATVEILPTPAVDRPDDGADGSGRAVEPGLSTG